MSAGDRIETDVCVIGGGPAGSTVAHRLASLGHKICLIEAHSFPRNRVGASLPASVLPLIEVIGARERLENAGFLRPEQILVWWSQASPSIGSLPGGPGFHVDRDEFDRLLLVNARANGASVLQPAHAGSPKPLRGGGWRIPVRHDGLTKEVISRYLVDASGSRNILGGRRSRALPPLLALYANWSVAEGGHSAGRVEAGENEWFWYAPLSAARSVAVVFVDPKRLSGTPRDDIEMVYRDLLHRFRLFCDVPVTGIEGPVRACDASSRYAQESAGASFVKVGDARVSLDPLSSQGVQTAIVSAIQAAAVVNTLARRPENSQAAIEFYRERQIETVRRYAGRTAAFYGERAAVCDRPFWRERALFAQIEETLAVEAESLDHDCLVALSDTATIEKTPVMDGDIIVPAFALRAGTLERPLAFLDGIEIVPLLRQVEFGRPARAIVQSWSERVPVQLGWKIMQWLWQRKIVVPMSA
jgi:flavin-dependent dehydrogenase